MIARALIAAALIALPGAAQAALTTNLNGFGITSTTTFTATGLNSASTAVLDGMTVIGTTSTGETTGSFSYGDFPYYTPSGAWTWSWVGTNDAFSGVMFDLGGDYRGGAAFVQGNPGNSFIIARDSDFNVLESYAFGLIEAVGDNTGAIRGILRDNADIRYIELRGAYAVAAQVYTGQGVAAPVPEPGEWAMIVAGLGVVGFVGRRRRKG